VGAHTAQRLTAAKLTSEGVERGEEAARKRSFEMIRLRCPHWPDSPKVEADDLTLSGDSVVAQFGMSQEGSDMDLCTSVPNWAEEKCKGSISLTHQRNLTRRFTTYVKSAVSTVN
jgi:hypothetical protein